MDEPLRLLMTETSPELCQLCAITLPRYNIELQVCPRNGLIAYDKILEYRPHAVLLDVFMPGQDAITLKNRIVRQHPGLQIQYYATGTFQNDELEREVMENGFSFYFLKPFDVEGLATRLSQSAEGRGAPFRKSLTKVEDMVTEMLRSIGMPAHIKGYRFLRDAIVLVIEEPGLMGAVTKELYPTIAAANDTNASRVERAIRHAIEVAWSRGDVEVINHYFGSTVNAQRGKPTNSEFIAMMSDRASIELRRQA